MIDVIFVLLQTKKHSNMKNLIITLSFLFVASFAHSQTWVDGYYKSDGTYVQGHYRTSPNSTNWDNWSTKGNTNPYKGNSGYKAPDYSIQSQENNASKTLYVGPRGGVYYINQYGNKVYVPKS